MSVPWRDKKKHGTALPGYHVQQRYLANRWVRCFLVFRLRPVVGVAWPVLHRAQLLTPNSV
jgi:hypothetical protein